MERITRHGMLMEIAHIVAERGTCSRLQVGAVFTIESRIIATGYNGAPRGMDHCDHQAWDWRLGPMPEWYREYLRDLAAPRPTASEASMIVHTDGAMISYRPITEEAPGCTISEHAERNAIAFAAKHGLALDRTTLFVTHAPCGDCARALINVGVEEVVYQQDYRNSAGLDLLNRAGIKVTKFLDLPTKD